MRSTSRLAQLAKKVDPRCTWDDLVLPGDAKVQLREICEQVRLHGRVFEEWGFGRKLSLGKGLHALFSGPSGTGKTMAAEIMAAELELELYKIDLSGVVSKYIGETEKNLDRVFAEAEATSAVLFFDEADALFGKRSDVKDAHDRYANIETSFLLQRMEEYDGVTILATNLRRNLDEAFSRRLAFVVQFPFTEAAERLLIWHRVFPAVTPRSEDVDLGFMARRTSSPAATSRTSPSRRRSSRRATAARCRWAIWSARRSASCRSSDERTSIRSSASTRRLRAGDAARSTKVDASALGGRTNPVNDATVPSALHTMPTMGALCAGTSRAQ